MIKFLFKLLAAIVSGLIGFMAVAALLWQVDETLNGETASVSAGMAGIFAMGLVFMAETRRQRLGHVLTMAGLLGCALAYEVPVVLPVPGAVLAAGLALAWWPAGRRPSAPVAGPPGFAEFYRYDVADWAMSREAVWRAVLRRRRLALPLLLSVAWLASLVVLTIHGPEPRPRGRQIDWSQALAGGVIMTIFASAIVIANRRKDEIEKEATTVILPRLFEHLGLARKERGPKAHLNERTFHEAGLLPEYLPLFAPEVLVGVQRDVPLIIAKARTEDSEMSNWEGLVMLARLPFATPALTASNRRGLAVERPRLAPELFGSGFVAHSEDDGWARRLVAAGLADHLAALAAVAGDAVSLVVRNGCLGLMIDRGAIRVSGRHLLVDDEALARFAEEVARFRGTIDCLVSSHGSVC